MSAAQWIEAGQFFVDPCADQFRSGTESRDVWQDLSLPLPLPESQVAALRRIAKRMNAICPGLTSGVIAVFTGCDAAGKLMAAEALAYEIQRTLYRVDAGEFGPPETTHFALLLSEAKAENAILMIDNACGLPIALIESLRGYSGLSILITDSAQEISTNLRQSAHYLVDFPFPADNE